MLLRRVIRECCRRSTTLSVRLNGRLMGVVDVPKRATNQEKELAALSLPEVANRVGDLTVKQFAVVDDAEVDIVV